MGRRKIQISKLEDEKNRQATFYKRKLGLIKKAAELAVLCDLSLYLVFTDPHGNVIKYMTEPEGQLLPYFERLESKVDVYNFTSEDYPNFFVEKPSKLRNREKQKLRNMRLRVRDFEYPLSRLQYPKEFLEKKATSSMETFMPPQPQLVKRHSHDYRLKVDIPTTSKNVVEQMNVLKGMNPFMDQPSMDHQSKGGVQQSTSDVFHTDPQASVSKSSSRFAWPNFGNDLASNGGDKPWFLSTSRGCDYYNHGNYSKVSRGDSSPLFQNMFPFMNNANVGGYVSTYGNIEELANPFLTNANPGEEQF
jgi:hypothetical protein